MTRICRTVHWPTSIKFLLEVYQTLLNARSSTWDVMKKMKIPPRSAIYEMNPANNSINKFMNGSSRNAARTFQFQVHFYKNELDGRNAGTFKGSNGWLEKFRTRHGIKHRAICEESATVDPVTVDDWKTRLPLIIDKYAPQDVYNADETGLFFKALPDRSLVMVKVTCKGGKRSKERFTVLLCTNMTGTDKLQPLLVGKLFSIDYLLCLSFTCPILPLRKIGQVTLFQEPEYRRTSCFLAIKSYELDDSQPV